MAINLRAPDLTELKPRIVVFGVGGAGGNAVNNMVDASLDGVEFAVANTDSQSLANSKASRRIQLGQTLTQGLGAGSRPEVGASAAEESLDEIREALNGCHMVFITAGMGGGTGTGAAPVIARAARDMGILTVGVVTKPFAFEGQRRSRLAEDGIQRLHASVDTLIIIPNQNLFRVANEKTTFAKAFAMADDVLYSGVRGITDLMVMPGLINLDFADVRTIMIEMGKAMMGTGEAEGDHRAIRAAEAAISNPLLDHSSMKGAKGVLINITGGHDLTLFEVDEAANKIRAEVDPDANIIVGSTFDERLEGKMRVSVVATGIDAEAMRNAPIKTSNETAISASPMVRAPVAAPSSTGNIVHALQAEIAQSAIGSSSTRMEHDDSALIEARKVASRVAAESSARQALAGAMPSMLPNRGGQPPLDLGIAGTQLPDEREQHRLAAATRTRSEASRMLVPEPKKKSALSFMMDIGRSSLGIGTSVQAPASASAQLPRAPQRRMLSAPSPTFDDDFGHGPLPPVPQQRQPSQRHVERRAPLGRSQATDTTQPQSSPYSEVGEDQLEIPAFLRRQVN